MPRRRRQPKPLRPTAIINRLVKEAPLTPWRATNDPVTELVLTLLSQNTSDTNSGRAFQALVKRYPDWDAVVEAPVEELEDTIRPGGLARTKAPRMQALLSQLRERLGPDWDASRLEDMPIDEAKKWLTELPGVGPKTAACVLLFSLGRPALARRHPRPPSRHTARSARPQSRRPPRARHARSPVAARQVLRLPRHPDPSRPPSLQQAASQVRRVRASGSLSKRRRISIHLIPSPRFTRGPAPSPPDGRHSMIHAGRAGPRVKRGLE